LEGDFDAKLSIIASSTNDSITSNVVIEGSANDPQVRFTSNPQLPQEEVLSQLLFGRRLESLSALQALQLANAVATLAGRGGEGIVGRLRQGFGLDDLDVQTNAEGTTQLTAGKYLSENIYSEIMVDQDGKSQINLNLDITDHITLKGRVGDKGDTGIGLFYERDY
ncbi:MAG: translocation/assembly module TamB domain-containing protein, partial [Paracoccaceae bacterium]